MKKLIFLPILALLLTACSGPVLESICEDNGVRRDCTAEEKSMIDDMHRIIKQVDDFDSSSLDDDFIKVKRGKDPSVMLFGEDHTATLGKIETLGAINHLMKKGDVLLLEGADRSYSLSFDHCGMFMIYNIYTYWQYQKNHEQYVPDDVSKYIRKRRFRELYRTTRASYDLSGLSIDDLQCQFWDHQPSLDEPDINRRNLKRRNHSQADAINANLVKGRRVMVNTGLLHMPLGEILFSQNTPYEEYDRFEKQADEFYSKSKIHRQSDRRISPVEKSEHRRSSSRVIHDLLKTVPSHAQFIHRRMINDPHEGF